MVFCQVSILLMAIRKVINNNPSKISNISVCQKFIFNWVRVLLDLATFTHINYIPYQCLQTRLVVNTRNVLRAVECIPVMPNYE